MVTAAGTYRSSVAVLRTGTYEWVATVRDANGLLLAQGACGNPSEQSKVVPFTLATAALRVAAVGDPIFDTATITGPTPAGATIRFSAYLQTSSIAVCDSSTLAYTGDPIAVTGPGSYPSASTMLPAGSYDWIAVVSDQGGQPLQAGVCGDPTEHSTVLPLLARTGVAVNAYTAWVAAGMLLVGTLLVLWRLPLLRRRRTQRG